MGGVQSLNDSNLVDLSQSVGWLIESANNYAGTSASLEPYRLEYMHDDKKERWLQSCQGSREERAARNA